MSGKVPQLLVSVRNAHEALSALRGGAEIIDVKEPANGSLGRASTDAISAVSQLLNLRSKDSTAAVSLSLALGEVNEWLNDSATLQSANLPSVIRNAQPKFLKLGLSDLCNSSAGQRTWFEAWMQSRKRIPGEHAWVAVAYADADRARAPSVFDVCEAAGTSQCRVLLIDTYEKDESSLLDWLESDQLRWLRSVTASRGLLLALAGRISEENLPHLAEFEPDIIAVRGAVCDRGVRTSAISEERVRRFRDTIRSLFSGEDNHN